MGLAQAGVANTLAAMAPETFNMRVSLFNKNIAADVSQPSLSNVRARDGHNVNAPESQAPAQITLLRMQFQ
jgi:hypothetical protein